MYSTLFICLVVIVSAVHGLQLLPTSAGGVTATASSSWAGKTPQRLVAGTGGWNSGNYGVQWIQVNLGAPFWLSSLSLVCDQTFTQPTTHTVYGGLEDDFTKMSALHTFNGTTSNSTVLSAKFSSARAQFIRVVTYKTLDWVAWKNISLFGESKVHCSDEMLVPTKSLQVSARVSGLADTKLTPDSLIQGTGSWNSGRWGENWIQINLGAPFLLSSISLTCDQTFIDRTTHIVYGSVYDGEPSVIAFFDGVTSNMQVLSAKLDHVEAQYIKILTNRTLDWVAWRNLTLYGARKSCASGNETTSSPACPPPPPTSTPSVPPTPPTEYPTDSPTEYPTDYPTDYPIDSPTDSPIDSPTNSPTNSPTESPTEYPTEYPIDSPTEYPTDYPTDSPTAPTEYPTNSPTDYPTESPAEYPTDSPTDYPKSPASKLLNKANTFVAFVLASLSASFFN